MPFPILPPLPRLLLLLPPALLLPSPPLVRPLLLLLSRAGVESGSRITTFASPSFWHASFASASSLLVTSLCFTRLLYFMPFSFRYFCIVR